MENMNNSIGADFLTESLCRHSRYVLDYCRKTWTNIHDFKSDKQIFYLADFIKDADELVSQLGGMLDKAVFLQKKGYLNYEQLEAESMLARRIIKKAEIKLEFLLSKAGKTAAEIS